MTGIRVDDALFHVELAGDGPPLVLLHGFTGSTETWAPFVEVFGDQYQLVAIDLLGHGQSDCPADPQRYCMERCLEDLQTIFEQLGLERVDLLGYSMGGRVALNLAAAAPHRITTLVLESASPGIQPSEDRQARRRSDARLADLLERDGIAAFVDHWENLPLFASQRGLPPSVRAALRSQRLRCNPSGLANSLRGLGTGVMTPLHDRLGDLQVPTLLVVGELDAKYRELGQAMAETLPAASMVIIPDAGHAVHLEQPGAFARTVLRFLDDHHRRTSFARR